MTKKTKNELAWDKLFTENKILYSIEKKGNYFISAKTIKKYREPRLMTKFDHQSQLPDIFKNNHLSILPVSRGEYIIAPMDAYKKLPTRKISKNSVVEVEFPNYIQSLDFKDISSESKALNAAYIAKIFDKFSDDELLAPTISGRMSSKEFDFSINNKTTKSKININVRNSQMEIDAGYEGIEKILLIEAKNAIPDDFLIRQLYYPYRRWSKKINKEIVPIFFTYSNGIYSLYQYNFEDLLNYNSAILVKNTHYRIHQTKEITKEDVLIISQNIKINDEPKVPFPQADTFERIVNLCEILFEENLSKNNVTELYVFDIRQTDYYANACIYLGLAEKIKDNNEKVYQLTDLGRDIFSLDYRNRNLKIIEQIMKHRAFNFTYKEYLKTLNRPSIEKTAEILKDSNIYNVKADSTFERRAQTVLSWIDWILDFTD